MANIDSFLSEGFLQEFIQSLPRDFFSDDFLPNIELYRFLDKHTDVILGGRKEDYSELVKTDGLTRNLIDRYLQGDESVKFENWSTDTLISHTNLFKFFFLSSSHSSMSYQLHDLGYPTYQILNNKNPKHIINYEAIVITKNINFANRLLSWDDLKSRILPFHSVIIIDNYLFADLSQTLSTIKMISSIFSPSNKVIHITLGYYEKTNGFSWENIKNCIERELPTQFLILSIAKFQKSSQFHDRVIITNSQLFVSGNSFSHFFEDNNAVKLDSPTILNINSHACNFAENDWSSIARLMLIKIKLLIRNSSIVHLGEPLANPLFGIN